MGMSAFPYPSILQRTSSEWHSKWQFFCTDCDDEGFTTKDDLMDHMSKFHFGQKFGSLSCCFCSARLSSESNLLWHHSKLHAHLSRKTGKVLIPLLDRDRIKFNRAKWVVAIKQRLSLSVKEVKTDARKGTLSRSRRRHLPTQQESESSSDDDEVPISQLKKKKKEKKVVLRNIPRSEWNTKANVFPISVFETTADFWSVFGDLDCLWGEEMSDGSYSMWSDFVGYEGFQRLESVLPGITTRFGERSVGHIDFGGDGFFNLVRLRHSTKSVSRWVGREILYDCVSETTLRFKPAISKLKR
eukprot:Lithocolla_globosa_v1_NODE_797_length_3267_cov_5.400374.p2 type:complete len:300 gc:universal NODE_797_length_3267_cov_5.400374:1500-601(-)